MMLISGSGKFSNYCTNCTVLESQDKAQHNLTCSCTPLVGSRGSVLSTINLGMLWTTHALWYFLSILG
jgi:hypothetical protein